MPMIIYQPLEANQQQFVNFWSLRYEYAEEHLYTNNIGQELTEHRILDLYRWKNGTPLSDKKMASVHRNFVQRLDELTQIQTNSSAKDFLIRFPNGGAIWRIFWLHCWQPNRFPIYDQHVHRAMAFIETGVPEEISQLNEQKIDAYLNRYLPFYAQFSAFNGRSVDKALWAFGKFIREANFPLTVPDENR